MPKSYVYKYKTTRGGGNISTTEQDLDEIKRILILKYGPAFEWVRRVESESSNESTLSRQ